MRNMKNRSFMARLIPACALAAMAILTAACSDDESDDFVGGASGDMGIVAKDIAGLAQKGPFVKDSKVTVQGIDCKTLELTDEIFEGKIKSDKGDFAFDDVTLSSTCALFEVSGIYRNEITGNTTSESVTLFALSDLKDRGHVNVNMLTDLECKRVLYLVTEKSKKFADAKKQAEKEVLAAFGIAGDFDNSEDLTIYESGDGNAALLAVSVLMQAGTDVPGLEKRMDGFKDSFAETGKWDDSETKAAIEEWQIAATADGTLDSIRKNVERLGYADEVPAFEKYIEAFGDTVILSSSSKDVEPAETSSSSSKVPEPAEGTLTDSRDGQTYRTVKIGNQVWMAENLNFETDSSYCYNDSAEYCAKYGRLYEWSAAMDACPSGWHLPDTAEWRMLLAAVGGDSIAGMKLKSTSGWNSDGNGTDDFGFTVLPAGGWDNKMFEGEAAGFWSSVGYGNYAAAIRLLADTFAVRLISGRTYVGHSVRCVKGSATAPKSSSSSENVILSGDSHEGSSSSSVTLATPCKTETEDNCEYGTLTDSRDGQTYKTVEIGSQVWMAENLNYAYTGVLYNNSGYTSDSTSWCFGNDPANCIKYGRLYTWAAAMDSVGTWSTNGKDCGYGVQCTPIYPVRGICPEGWHLPDKAEWNTLFTAVGGASTAGKMLSSTISWSSVPGGWVRDGYGTDAYSFSALPAGLRNATGYNNVGYHAYFWSSSEYNSSRTYIVGLDDEFDKADLYGSGKDYGYSVRCLKNDDATAPKSSSSSAGEVNCSALLEEERKNGAWSWDVPKECRFNPDIDYGTMTDERDGKVYRTVKIGNQVWMAENLNYYDSTNLNIKETSWCYGKSDNKDSSTCDVTGRLYTWAAAITVCPSDWRLPSDADWDSLFSVVGGRSGGRNLKSLTGWYGDGGGTDSFGFSAIPGGHKYDSGAFFSVGIYAYFWSSTEREDGKVRGMSLYYSYDDMTPYIIDKNVAYSVRCVKD